MKDAINRVVGVVDETGAVISCSELNLIGEVREGYMAERLTAGDRFVRDGYTYQQFSNAKHNDYAVFVEGADETAGQFAGAQVAVSSREMAAWSASTLRMLYPASRAFCTMASACPGTDSSRVSKKFLFSMAMPASVSALYRLLVFKWISVPMRLRPSWPWYTA